MNINEMSNYEKDAILTLGICTELKNWGYIAGGGATLTPKGIATFDQILASGYKLNRKSLPKILQNSGSKNDINKFITMISGYLDKQFPEQKS